MFKRFKGAIMLVSILFLSSGCTTMKQVNALDDGAIPAYKKMFFEVLEHGDPAKAMMNEYQIAEDISNEEVASSIKELAEEYNMMLTGDVKMFTKEDAKPNEVKHSRIFSLCSLPIAKEFLNYSRYFGGFMPCRILLVEYGNGDRYLVTMDLTLAIYGGKPLPKEMLELAKSVQEAMTAIPKEAATGDI